MNDTYDDLFGIDLGDGESAVAWLSARSRTEPQIVEIRGRKSVLTAVGEKDGTVLIGEEACHASGLSALNARFKRLFLTSPGEAEPWLERFARALADNLRADGRLSDERRARFLVGCPSGWDDESRERYRALMERAGMADARVCSESRAAFLFARESGELRAGGELLSKPTLIVDAGSSTTDFTFVSELSEKRLASDFGETALGGGLIDRLLLEKCVSRSPYRESLRGVFSRYPQYAARAELEARRVKELYFINLQRGGDMPSASSVKIYALGSPITLDIDCDDRDMRELLSAPIEALGGKTFRGALKSALEAARLAMPEGAPETVLLTGGASRMGFVEEDTRACFPNATVLRALEPEFAIARGLCYALRVDSRIEGFHDEVRALDESGALESAVSDRLPRLFGAMSLRVAQLVTDELAPAAFARWREGALGSIADMGQALGDELRARFERGEMNELIREDVADWLDSLRPDIEALTDPICDRYELPRTSMRLDGALPIAPGSLTLRADTLVKLDSVKVALDVVVASVAAVAVGGGGVALIAGPAGLAVGFVAGLLAGVAGTELAGRALSKARLPVALRRLLTQKRFEKSLRERQTDVAGELYAQLERELDPPSEGVAALTRATCAAIEARLVDAANRAALLIH